MNWNNELAVKDSKICGKGVFALRDFKKDELILRVTGKIIKAENYEGLPSHFKSHLFPFDKTGNKCKYFLPEKPWMYLNHSCNPNAGIKNNREIVATKEIKKGEEITFDYAMNNIDNWEMECSCKAENCRKLIGSFDSLDEKTKRKYKDYILDCLKRKL